MDYLVTSVRQAMQIDFASMRRSDVLKGFPLVIFRTELSGDGCPYLLIEGRLLFGIPVYNELNI